MTALAFLQQDEKLYAPLIQVIRRGTAWILESGKDGVFLHDEISGGFLMACLDVAKAKEWLLKWEHLNYYLIEFCLKNEEGLELKVFMEEHYGLEINMQCREMVDSGRMFENTNENIQIREVKKDEVSWVYQHYNLISFQEMEEIQGFHNLFLAEYRGEKAGFIGSHLEGSLGLLFVLREYRRMGIGEALEQFMIQHFREKGWIPHAQIELDNEPSFALQQRLGLMEAKGLILWCFSNKEKPEKLLHEDLY